MVVSIDSSKGWKSVCILTDSLPFVNAFNSDFESYWEIRTVFNEIKQLMGYFENFRIE